MTKNKLDLFCTVCIVLGLSINAIYNYTLGIEVTGSLCVGWFLHNLTTYLEKKEKL